MYRRGLSNIKPSRNKIGMRMVSKWKTKRFIKITSAKLDLDKLHYNIKNDSDLVKKVDGHYESTTTEVGLCRNN